MQGFGILLSSLVIMIVCSIFEACAGDLISPSKLQQSENVSPVPPESDLAWRLILMIGAIPASMTYYWRMKMPETARFTALVDRNTLQAAKDMEKVLNVSLSSIQEDIEMMNTPNTRVALSNTYSFFSREFLRRHGRDLFAASFNWFLVDIVFYSLNLFQYYTFKGLLASKSTMNLYVPAELFPARFRATCHGISGAVGKVGAIIGTVGYIWASRDPQNGLGVSNTFAAMGGVCVLGFFTTYFFTRETMGRSLEQNENVDKFTGSSIQLTLQPVPPSVTFKGKGHGELQINFMYYSNMDGENKYKCCRSLFFNLTIEHFIITKGEILAILQHSQSLIKKDVVGHTHPQSNIYFCSVGHGSGLRPREKAHQLHTRRMQRREKNVQSFEKLRQVRGNLDQAKNLLEALIKREKKK
ncbi:hypothetical protein L1987_79033 [Smallanthus sonchifolius]|uniref:Uncharacterized protein n=1 Tax=Smallanthus sonchifolius TaxID=185202 RepID=A0ACB8ZFC3_9ASTR|nr:hypothetical protein L1987_79033 [Smallanthus sonchifolius]